MKQTFRVSGGFRDFAFYGLFILFVGAQILTVLNATQSSLSSSRIFGPDAFGEPLTADLIPELHVIYGPQPTEASATGFVDSIDTSTDGLVTVTGWTRLKDVRRVILVVSPETPVAIVQAITMFRPDVAAEIGIDFGRGGFVIQLVTSDIPVKRVCIVVEDHSGNKSKLSNSSPELCG